MTLRLSLPEHVPMQYVAGFASVLILLQQLEGTSLAFSAYAFLFIVIIGFAFNEAGGLTRPSGAYIFFYATLGVIVGLCWKAILGEPADTHLSQPQLTMLIYAGGAAGLYVAATLSRRFRKKRPYLQDLVSLNNLPNATIGCLVVGTTLQFLNRFTVASSGSLLTALYQVNHFNELAILLGVTYTIRRTGGRRSINLPVAIAMAVIFVMGGLLGFSKEAMFSPLACWTAAAAAQNYRLTRARLFTLAIVGFVLFHFMVPYSQYGRTFRATDYTDNIAVASKLLGDLSSVRQHALKGDAWEDNPVYTTYFNTPQGFFDRLQMITPDDGLNDLTQRKGTYGLYPIAQSFENLIPHFLNPNKVSVLWGNAYLHEEGAGLAEDDFTTGISFSPTGEAFHLASWAGVLVLAPAIWTLAFLLFDSLCGDTRRSPWGLLASVIFAHIAPEGLLAGLIYEIGYGSFAIVLAAVLSAYVMPHLGGLLVGPGTGKTPVPLRTRARTRSTLRLPAPESSES